LNIVEEVNLRFSKQKEFIGSNKIINNINPLVSVCVQTYQHSKYIKECLDGILMQKTEFPFEVIVGEDDSSDGTREICIEYAKKNPDKIRLFLRDRKLTQLKDKEGNLVRRLNGIFTRMSARGFFIALCEGDDYWTDPNKLQKQVSEMRKFPRCDISFHPVIKQIMNSHEKDVIDFRRATHNCIFDLKNVIIGGGGFCSTASLLIKTDTHNKYLPHLLNAPAGDYFMQVFGSLNGGALYIDEVMAVYRRNVPGSWSESNLHLDNYLKFNFRMIKSRGEVDSILNYKFKRYFLKRDIYVLKKVIKKYYASKNKNSISVWKYINKIYLGDRYPLYIISAYYIVLYKLYFNVKRAIIK
jgi:glycosyltransferase involved in cell wall biosynthesis